MIMSSLELCCVGLLKGFVADGVDEDSETDSDVDEIETGVTDVNDRDSSETRIEKFKLMSPVVVGRDVDNNSSVLILVVPEAADGTDDDDSADFTKYLFLIQYY